jgi:hypothetical protein
MLEYNPKSEEKSSHYVKNYVKNSFREEALRKGFERQKLSSYDMMESAFIEPRQRSIFLLEIKLN